MTREEAIDVLQHNYPSACFTDLCEAVDIAIQALSAQPRQTCEYWDSESNFCALCRPSAQQWIPVSSGELPEANEIDEKGFIKAYLVQDGRWMDVARWDGEDWIAWGYGTALEDVTAWMPLPKPWEGGAENE